MLRKTSNLWVCSQVHGQDTEQSTHWNPACELERNGVEGTENIKINKIQNKGTEKIKRINKNK